MGNFSPPPFLDVARPRQAIGQAERREALREALREPPGGGPKGVGGRRPRIVKEPPPPLASWINGSHLEM
eukprot:26686-Prorocentrum_minimum.AAC.1